AAACAAAGLAPRCDRSARGCRCRRGSRCQERACPGPPPGAGARGRKRFAPGAARSRPENRRAGRGAGAMRPDPSARASPDTPPRPAAALPPSGSRPPPRRRTGPLPERAPAARARARGPRRRRGRPRRGVAWSAWRPRLLLRGWGATANPESVRVPPPDPDDDIPTARRAPAPRALQGPRAPRREANGAAVVGVVEVVGLDPVEPRARARVGVDGDEEIRALGVRARGAGGEREGRVGAAGEHDLGAELLAEQHREALRDGERDVLLDGIGLRAGVVPAVAGVEDDLGAGGEGGGAGRWGRCRGSL